MSGMPAQAGLGVVTAPVVARNARRPVPAPVVTLALLIGSAAALVPLLYRTGWRDVFTAPKLSALWAVLGVCLLLACLVAVVRGGGVLAFQPSRAADVAFAGWLLTNLLAFAWSVDRHQSLFGERYWYRGLLTVLLEGGFFLIARIAFARGAAALVAGRGHRRRGDGGGVRRRAAATRDGPRLRDRAAERTRLRDHRPAGLVGRLSRDRDRDDRGAPGPASTDGTGRCGAGPGRHGRRPGAHREPGRVPRARRLRRSGARRAGVDPRRTAGSSRLGAPRGRPRRDHAGRGGPRHSATGSMPHGNAPGRARSPRRTRPTRPISTSGTRAGWSRPTTR